MLKQAEIARSKDLDSFNDFQARRPTVQHISMKLKTLLLGAMLLLLVVVDYYLPGDNHFEKLRYIGQGPWHWPAEHLKVNVN